MKVLLHELKNKFENILTCRSSKKLFLTRFSNKNKKYDQQIRLLYRYNKLYHFTTLGDLNCNPDLESTIISN